MNELHHLIVRLRDLHDGRSVFFDVVRAGPQAIRELEAMVREEPQSIFEHRCLAADALAAIGSPDAWAALVRALEDVSQRKVPASLTLAEDAVADRIATHLATRTHDPRAVEALLAALAVRPRPEVARALGQLHEERAIPMLVACLDDDFARDGAMAALMCFGVEAEPELAAKLARSRDADPYEAPHLVAGRAAAATLLGRAHLSVAKKALAGALDDPSPQVRRAAALALATSNAPNRNQAIPPLIEALDDPSWLNAKPVIDGLVALGQAAVTPLVNALAEPARDNAGQRRQERILETLAQLAPKGAATTIARVADGNPDPRAGLAAVAALEAIPGDAATAPLITLLNNPVPAVRERALRALAHRGVTGARAMALALADPAKHVRRTVWQCAAKLDAEARREFITVISKRRFSLRRFYARLRLNHNRSLM